MSSSVVVRYRTHPESAVENGRLIEDVYAALAELAPPGFHYATFRLDDGATFVHVANRDDGAENPLPTLPAFAAFQSGLPQRCSEPPQVSEASLLGSYGFML